MRLRLVFALAQRDCAQEAESVSKLPRRCFRRLAAATASDLTHAEILGSLLPVASAAAHSTRVRSASVKRTGIGAFRRRSGSSGGLPREGILDILADYKKIWTGINLSTTLIGMNTPVRKVDYVAKARLLLQEVATAKLFVKAAEIITADEPVSGSRGADRGTLGLIRDELVRREFGVLSDQDLVSVARQYCASESGSLGASASSGRGGN